MRYDSIQDRILIYSDHTEIDPEYAFVAKPTHMFAHDKLSQMRHSRFTYTPFLITIFFLIFYLHKKFNGDQFNIYSISKTSSVEHNQKATKVNIQQSQFGVNTYAIRVSCDTVSQQAPLFKAEWKTRHRRKEETI